MCPVDCDGMENGTVKGKQISVVRSGASSELAARVRANIVKFQHSSRT